MIEHEQRARRREVGRSLLGVAEALSRVIADFNRSKDDPSASTQARAACDEALDQVRKLFQALRVLRDSLGRGERTSLLDRPSLA